MLFNACSKDPIADKEKQTEIVKATPEEEMDWGNGVNIQPTYFNSGLPQFAWGLMNQYSKIKTVRIELDPNAYGFSISNVKLYIYNANVNGYKVIATYHLGGSLGSDSKALLLQAANWWKAHYNEIRGSSSNGSFHINLSNEWGSNNLSSTNYANYYNEAIAIVRQVYAYNIIIDCPGYGAGTRVAAAAYPNITDKNITYSVHVYPNSYNKDRYFTVADIETFNTKVYGKCILGEFGNYPYVNNVDWSGVVSKAKQLGWPVLGWCWNGDNAAGNGGPMNMVAPSWASSGGANQPPSNYYASGYFNTIYSRL